jgi:beta-lactamase regulating signal transducer with metallopeptidase domain
MNFAFNFQGMAVAATERLLYGAVAGTLLAAVVWALLQLFPRRDSRTSFAVWFSTLLATAILPLLSLHDRASSGGASHAVVTLSAAWAWYVFVGWATIALVGLARVVLATVQLRKLRAEATSVAEHSLHADLRSLIEEFQRSRPVDLLVSPRLEVPTAIGFRRPCILLPTWLLESSADEELRYILLHELAHLSRRDDWTNLVQQVLKALLFFLPSVWWIERRLTMDREVACDDAVLAQTGAPRGYAECLARVAERSFLRRQLALAQAAVGRVRQLTQRVAMILDPNRPRTTQLWKPAIPAVMFLAGLCAFPASLAPSLVSFAGDVPKTHAVLAQTHSRRGLELGKTQSVETQANGQQVRAVEARLKIDSSRFAPATLKNQRPSQRDAARMRATSTRGITPAAMLASREAMRPQKCFTVREELFVAVTQQTESGEQQSWQMYVVQVSVQPQPMPVLKPRKI